MLFTVNVFLLEPRCILLLSTSLPIRNGPSMVVTKISKFRVSCHELVTLNSVTPTWERRARCATCSLHRLRPRHHHPQLRDQPHLHDLYGPRLLGPRTPMLLSVLSLLPPSLKNLPQALIYLHLPLLRPLSSISHLRWRKRMVFSFLNL